MYVCKIHFEECEMYICNYNLVVSIPYGQLSQLQLQSRKLASYVVAEFLQQQQQQQLYCQEFEISYLPLLLFNSAVAIAPLIVQLCLLYIVQSILLESEDENLWNNLCMRRYSKQVNVFLIMTIINKVTLNETKSKNNIEQNYRNV